MPTYDYKCDDCGYDFEKFQSINARKLTKCPRCGGKVKRLIGTGAGIIFKGSGFYETDYRSKSYRDGEKKDKDSLKVPSKKSESKEKKASKDIPAKSSPKTSSEN